MARNCILQVEDDENDVFFLKRVFDQAGIDCPLHTVTDGETAINYLSGVGELADRKAHPLPSLVLLDLKLPGKSGLEVLQWIRQQPELRKLVVVMFSSSALEDDVERAYDFGANSYIEKPLNPSRLREIAQLLKGWWLGYNHFPPIHQEWKDQLARPS